MPARRLACRDRFSGVVGVLELSENSLSMMFLVLFLMSIALHAVGGPDAYSSEELLHGNQAVSVWQYLGTSQFWFESMQNWQSGFLAIGVMVGASVYLRQRGSAESKPVAEPHSHRGTWSIKHRPAPPHARC